MLFLHAMVLIMVFAYPTWLRDLDLRTDASGNEIVVVFLVRMEGCKSCVLPQRVVKDHIDTWQSLKKKRVVRYLSLVRCSRAKDMPFIAKHNFTAGVLVADLDGSKSLEVSGSSASVVAVVYQADHHIRIHTADDLHQLR